MVESAETSDNILDAEVNMNYLFLSIIILAFSGSAFALSKSDLKTVKSAQGLYLLDEKKLNEDQRRICLEGDLELKEKEGVLSLGGTVLALAVETDHALQSQEPSTQDGCNEESFTKMKKNTLHFESVMNCTADKMKVQIQREITFGKDSLTYKQINVVNGDKVEVECKLKKTHQSKSEKPWKVEPEVEEIPQSK